MVDQTNYTRDYRTKREMRRDELHAKVCQKYTELHDADPDVSLHRLSIAIGDELEITKQAVVRILRRHGLYTPKQTTTQH